MAIKTLDWDVLRKFVAERDPVEVSAGCLRDWFWTGATVYKDGAYIKDHGAYYSTDWGCPGFKAEMPNGDTLEVYAERDELPEEAAARIAEREKRRAEMPALLAALTKEYVSRAAKSTGGAA